MERDLWKAPKKLPSLVLDIHAVRRQEERQAVDQDRIVLGRVEEHPYERGYQGWPTLQPRYPFDAESTAER